MAKIPCPHCSKTFKTESGLRWHLGRIHQDQAEVDGVDVPVAVLDEPDSSIERADPLEEMACRVEALEKAVAELRDDHQRYREEILNRMESLKHSWDDQQEETRKMTSALGAYKELLKKIEALTGAVDEHENRLQDLIHDTGDQWQEIDRIKDRVSIRESKFSRVGRRVGKDAMLHDIVGQLGKSRN